MKKINWRSIIWITVIVIILMIPMVMQFTSEVQWNEAIAYIIILLIVGSAYELWQWLKTRDKIYRIAFGIGLASAFLLFWMNGAVGLIGSEDNPANLMYGAVFAVGLIGSLISRFKPSGMARTLFTATLIQLSVPVVALLIWPAQASWGDAGVIGVFILNGFFAVLFMISGLLFQRASDSHSK